MATLIRNSIENYRADNYEYKWRLSDYVSIVAIEREEQLRYGDIKHFKQIRGQISRLF